jgi:hypothetical protein
MRKVPGKPQKPMTKEEVQKIVTETLQRLQIRVEEKTGYGYGGEQEKYIKVQLLLETEKEPVILSEDFFDL